MDTFDLRLFGDRVREARHKADLSQQALADLMAAPQGWLSELENARQTHVQADTVFRLCRALQVSADYLMGLIDDPATPRQAAVADHARRSRQHNRETKGRQTRG